MSYAGPVVAVDTRKLDALIAARFKSELAFQEIAHLSSGHIAHIRARKRCGLFTLDKIAVAVGRHYTELMA